MAFSRTVPPILNGRPGTHEHYSPPARPFQCLVQGEGGTLGNPLGDGYVRPNLRVRIRGAGGRRSCMLGKTVELLASINACMSSDVCVYLYVSHPPKFVVRAL